MWVRVAGGLQKCCAFGAAFNEPKNSFRCLQSMALEKSIKEEPKIGSTSTMITLDHVKIHLFQSL